MAASSIGGGGPQTNVFGPRIDPNPRGRVAPRNCRPKLIPKPNRPKRSIKPFSVVRLICSCEVLDLTFGQLLGAARWRYKVARPIPSTAAISLLGVPSSIMR